MTLAHRRAIAAIPLAFLPLLTSCPSMEHQLQRVAKDWSMVIRASQVMPVYPLSEDLQPGDLFVVQKTIQKQHEIWREKGFLPLDQRVARLDPSGYGDFYDTSFGVAATGEDDDLPMHWMRRTGTPPAHRWSEAPLAAFPTYSFSVRNAQGIGLALPIQGIPVAMSLLGTSAVEGSVTIADAHTYGIDQQSLRADLDEWLQEKGGREFLAEFASTEERPSYLRVVARVYLTGRVNVSVHQSASSGGGVTAGAGRPLDLVTPTTSGQPGERSKELYEETLKALNESLGKAVTEPGGSLKVAAASARSVSLAETFARPLVIGYIGFDMRILPGGALGPALDTRELITGDTVEVVVGFSDRQGEVASLLADVKADAAATERAITALQRATPALAAVAEEDPPAERLGLMAGLFLDAERKQRAGPRHDQLVRILRAAKSGE